MSLVTHIRVLAGHGASAGEDAVVGRAFRERFGHTLLVAIAYDDVQHTAPLAQRGASQMQFV